MKFILFFDEIAHRDIVRVGGKGANLGELSRAGFNVPAGFCVTTDAFAAFMSRADDTVLSQLDRVSGENLDALRQAGKLLRTHLSRLTLPREVKTAVLTAWRELGEDHAYAVRSSATAEDLPQASFAGQQDTYLNVRGQEYLLRRVKDCFISLFTDRAILYRVQNNFDHHQVALSVVVQHMVQPEVAGIMFTADPITNDRKIISIDASFGLGEALVSGLVSADLYQVEKQTQRIIKKQIANKQLAIRSLPTGGTHQIALETAVRQQQALKDHDILALARIGESIEKHYGTPQDIEWALLEDSLFITQSRPITSLFPVPTPRPTDDDLHLYFSFSHFQVMTDAIKPLALSILRVLVPVGHANGALESLRMVSSAGRLYGDLSPILRHPLGKRLIIRALSNADQMAANALAILAERPDFKSSGERVNPLSILPKARPYLFKVLTIMFQGKPEGRPEEVSALIDSYIADSRQKLKTAASSKQQLALVIDDLQTFFSKMLVWVPDMIAGVVATTLLHKLVDKKTTADDLAAIGRGLMGNVATDMNLAVGDLADLARASHALLETLSDSHSQVQLRLAKAKDLEGGEVFLDAWEAFLDRYGSRGPSEIDLSRPRWSEEPSSLMQMVVNSTNQVKLAAHHKHHQQLVAEGEAASKRLIQKAQQSWWGALKKPLVKRLIRLSRKLMPLREHHKFFAIRALALIKPVLQDIGVQFYQEGRLTSAEDIWFLHVPEILEALDQPEKNLVKICQERKRDFERYKDLSPPRVITSEGEIPPLRLDIDAPEGALVGSPVSPGVVEGSAKVVLDPSHEVLKPGEILVAPFTDPGWTPLFVNAAGLVTEVGGLMTHGSLVAREYGIPAVVGVIDATKQIKTGQQLRIHGDAGYVEVLSDEVPLKANAKSTGAKSVPL